MKFDAAKTAIMLLAVLFVTPPVAGAEPKSGYEYLQQESREMQDDDFMNPGMSAVESGAALFRTAGKNGKSCASCHGDAGEKLDTVNIAKYPVYSDSLAKPVTLQQQIHICWTDNLKNEPLKYDSSGVLDLEVFVRNLARGEKVQVQTDGPMQPFWEQGREIYQTRAGQLDMSCNLCHENYAGMKIRANTLSQGQSNGFPAYRLKNGKINGLHSRFNGCYAQFRAEKLPPGNDDFVALEVYVNSRGNGLAIETPAIRF
jgi:sulfur-oxidizing protein SoxA